jgi:ArsR family transcriptional regulator
VSDDGACCEVPPVAVAGPVAPSDDQLAAMAKALGHPARIKILRVLAARRECVTNEVVGQLGLAQSTVSEHLRILRAAGLITGEIDGPRVRYCIDPRGLAHLKAGLDVL